MRRIAAPFLIVCLLVTGCGSPITSGEVVSKEFVPEHEEYTPDQKIGDITIYGGWDTIPDAWYITIQKKDEDGEVKTRTFHVTKELFDSLKVGDWYAVPQRE